jgi:hypothetical protein
MKRLFTILFTTLMYVVLTLGMAYGAQWKIIERVRYDWRSEGQECEFILRAPSDYDAGGDFTQLNIVRRTISHS